MYDKLVSTLRLYEAEGSIYGETADAIEQLILEVKRLRRLLRGKRINTNGTNE